LPVIRKNKITESGTQKLSRQKISKDINHVTATQSQMARALKISTPRVNQMIKEGMLPIDETGSPLLVEGIKAYCRMKKQAVEDEDVDFDKERALHEKAKREIAELKLDKMRKNAYSAAVVEYVMTAMAANLRTQLLGMPSKLAPFLEGKSKEEIYSLITKEIEEKLSELSEYSPDLFNEEIEQEEEDDDEIG
jgi:phage terminase Nu1 subunit (DNA packaging protein)